jgi:hypothetical protein
MQNLRYGWVFFRLAWKVGGKERRLLNPSLVIVLAGLLWTLVCLVPIGFILYLGQGSYLGLIGMGFILILLVTGLLTLGHIFSIGTASLFYTYNHPNSSLPSAWQILGRSWLDVLALSAASSGISLMRLLTRRQPVPVRPAPAAPEAPAVRNSASQSDADTQALFKPPAEPPARAGGMSAGSEAPTLVSASQFSPLSLAPESEQSDEHTPDPRPPANADKQDTQTAAPSDGSQPPAVSQPASAAPSAPKPSFAWAEVTYLIVPILAIEGLPLRDCLQQANRMVTQKLVRIDPALINVRGICRWLGALLAVIGLALGALAGFMVADIGGGSALLDAIGVGVGGLIASPFCMVGIAAGYFATTLYHTSLYEWACAVENVLQQSSELPPVPALLAAALGVNMD